MATDTDTDTSAPAPSSAPGLSTAASTGSAGASGVKRPGSPLVADGLPAHQFVQVDTFTSSPLAGNPCVVVFDADDFTVPTMQAIAREMNLSTTAFVLRAQDSSAEVRLRYFTSAQELPLAGNTTIGGIYALFECGRMQFNGRNSVTVPLQLGSSVGQIIQVEAIAGCDGRVEKVVMNQLPPVFMNLYQARDVMPLFGLTEDDAMPDAPLQTVSTGTPQLMVPVKDLEALRKAQVVDMRAYEAFRAKADFLSPHLFALGGVTPEAHTFARHFGTPPDLFEESFTGSGTGSMAAYLWKYRLINTPKFVAEQGHWMNRPGKADVEVVGDPDNIQTVKVGGCAVIVLRGELEF